jgi:hypothetical protein
MAIFDPMGTLIIETTADASRTVTLTLEAGQYSILISREGSNTGTSSGDYTIQVAGE